jgi:hypothetical protein
MVEAVRTVVGWESMKRFIQLVRLKAATEPEQLT